MKKVGIIKRVSCIGLIFLLSINSFAAIVSDNDGSAFITKAEFDALKSSFQSQIDTYNQSIDSKIDGAIASYLAGIRLSNVVQKSTLVNKYDKVANYGNANYLYVYGRPTWNAAILGTYNNRGMESKVSGRQFGDSAAAAAYWTSKKTFNNPITSQGAKELVISKNTDAAGLPYVMDGYYTNVHHDYTCDTEIQKVPADSGYSYIKASMQIGGVPRDFTTSGDAASPNTCYVDGCCWSYNSSPTHKDMGADWYGPLNIRTQGYKTNGTTMIGSVTYANDLTTKVPKTNTYFISGKAEAEVFTNANNRPYDWMTTTNNGITTETLNSFDAAATVRGFTYILYVFDCTTKTEETKRGKQDYYGNVITNYASQSTYTSTEMALSGNIPVFSAMGKIKANQIRQQEDKLVDSELSSIELKNLSLNNGFPLCIEKEETRITWSPVFVDDTKDYYVWLSYSPFLDETTTTEANDLLKFNDDTGTLQNYKLIKGGSGKITFTMEKSSPIYVKFAEKTGEDTWDYTKGELKLSDCNYYMQEKNS